MKNYIFAIVFGLIFLTGTANAAQYNSIFLSKDENQTANAVFATCDVLTIHTERIQDDLAGSGEPYVAVLRNFERMLRSAENCGLQVPKLWAAVDRVNLAVNSGVRIPIYGRSAAIMKHFTDLGLRYAGE